MGHAPHNGRTERQKGMWALLALLGCPSPVPVTTPPQDSASFTTAPEDRLPLTLTPSEVIADQRVGYLDVPPLVLDFQVPESLEGRGLPAWLYVPTDEDLSLIQLEIPVIGKELADEATRSATTLNPPLLCRIGTPCAHLSEDGYWYAEHRRDGEWISELQLALSRTDQAEPGVPVRNILGVWLQPSQRLEAGDEVRFVYHGHVPARATSWTPLRPRLRWRVEVLDDCPASDRSCWHELEDEDVQGLNVLPDVPAFTKIQAPMDVQSGVPFDIRVVMLDRYANPSPFSGLVELTGSVEASLSFKGEAIGQVSATVQTPGPHRVTASFPQGAGTQIVPQWFVAHAQPPAHARWVGDLHLHTGDGGAQRKFLGMFKAGDHAGLFTSIKDSLRYLDEVSGHDFGAVSEHAMRDDGYLLPAGVDTDPAFQPGGVCTGATSAFQDLNGWWPLAQQASAASDGGHDGQFTVFPAFEWQSHHNLVDRTPAHRVVVFRDFDEGHKLPMLPGDVTELNPRCILRFLDRAGYGPEQVLVLPHMQMAVDGNIDWSLTYTDGPSPLVSRDLVESYQRLGEIFSARSYSSVSGDRRPVPALFEGDASTPATWTHRFAWRELAAHFGVMAASDTHMGAPGSDDDRMEDGTLYTYGEAGGTTVVLAPSTDRHDLWEGLSARRTYGTTGPRFWLDFTIEGVAMGDTLTADVHTLSSEATVHVGLPIRRVELFGVRVGDATMPYQTLWSEDPMEESWSRAIPIPRPTTLNPDGEEWLYYVRALAGEEGVPFLESEAAWSSPIWVTWVPVDGAG
jgi:hypothetical protein